MTCEKCDRPARQEVHHLGEWRPMCRYHIGAYYDLPHRKAAGTTTTVVARRETDQPICRDWVDDGSFQGHACHRPAKYRVEWGGSLHPGAWPAYRFVCGIHARHYQKHYPGTVEAL